MVGQRPRSSAAGGLAGVHRIEEQNEQDRGAGSRACFTVPARSKITTAAPCGCETARAGSWSATWPAFTGPCSFAPNRPRSTCSARTPNGSTTLSTSASSRNSTQTACLNSTPITDADGVAKWTDSIFNAGVPLHQGFHIGVMPMGKAQAQNPPATADAQNSPDAGDQAQAASAPGDPESAGVDHYPTPIVDIQLFKYDDFQLWVTDSEGNPAAVTPVGARGSGVASVHVQYATPGSQLARQKQQQESAGGALILPADHPLAQQAFQNQ